ncbi:HAMP domain-containing protein [Nostoc sp. FACHB-152]|uniref:sensor histidine kinase n=1 Tax=unclassified Nostoc TaxID=2593658 RepID=UPI0016871CF1|nr:MULTISPECIES: ATP-binding protein [unclassified Nostoc]MBD2451905.1 HAMP domain-containing protein [Nostoc sp. FACHB-152]MBD2472471.1 HAMP domain-containing protein [Nostoc sp. FACHB-145]
MKQLRSFQLRIALLAAALAGSTLVGFGAVSWFQIYNAKMSQFDTELLNQLMRASRPHERERLHRRPELLSFGLESNSKTPIAMLVLDGNGNTIFQFNSLPADIQVNRLLVQRLQATPSPPPPPREQPNPPLDLPPRPLPPQFVTAKTATATWRIGAIKFPDNQQVAIAVSLQAVDQEMATIRNIFLVSIPVSLLLVTLGAGLISRRALRPISQLTDAIQQVTVKGLDQRIPIGKTDVEFVELIQVFNQMLSRLERSFTQASRFSADAAHELKTPLTILQGELERTLQQVDPGSEVQQRLSNLLDEVRRLSGIMRKLLLLSLADAGQMSLYLVEVDMSQLLMEMVEDVELLAPHLIVQTDIPTGLKVQGDRDLLMQVLQNLLSNAIKYNLADGWIKIEAQKLPTNIQITIANASKDIPASDRHRLFDRFYRGDPARNRQVEGIGLGLSLAREIARAHRGDLTLNAISDGQTAFTLTLPIQR